MIGGMRPIATNIADFDALRKAEKIDIISRASCRGTT